MTSVPRGVDGLTYLGDWLTLDQAASALGISTADLRPLWQAGDLDVVAGDAGWRVRTSTIHDLLAGGWAHRHA